MKKYKDRERLKRYARWMLNQQDIQQRRKILADHDEHYGKELTDDLRSELVIEHNLQRAMTDHERHKQALADNQAQQEVLHHD